MKKISIVIPALNEEDGIGQGYSNKQVVDTINQVTGLNLEVNYGPRREGDADSLYAANEKIKSVLGWQPQYGLKEIIESAFKWHSSHPQGFVKTA